MRRGEVCERSQWWDIKFAGFCSSNFQANCKHEPSACIHVNVARMNESA